MARRVRLPTLAPRVPTLDTRKVKPPAKTADPHYQSKEHEDWALKIKKRAGWRCEHVEQGVRCERSRARGDRMHADHVREIKDRPDLALDLNNGKCLCTPHNTSKGIQARAARMTS